MLDTECGQVCKKNKRLDTNRTKMDAWCNGYMHAIFVICRVVRGSKKKLGLNRLDTKFGQIFEILVYVRLDKIRTDFAKIGRKSLVWKVWQTCTGSICRLLPLHSGASIPSRVPGGWQPHKHAHVQWTSSHHAFPSRRHRLDRPATEQFRGAVVLPSLHHPRSIPACTLLSPSSRCSPRLYFHQ